MKTIESLTTAMRKLYLNRKLCTGGFYELAIQVGPSADTAPTDRLAELFWSLPQTGGPYDWECTCVVHPQENYQNSGLILLNDYLIPVSTTHIREEPFETGASWFIIGFYAEAIERVFGRKYNVWQYPPQPPEAITAFFREMIIRLYQSFPYEMALIGHEISGRWKLQELMAPCYLPGEPYIYVGAAHIGKIAVENLPFIIPIESL